MRFKLYFSNPDCPELGQSIEIHASSYDEAWAKGSSMTPHSLLRLEDVLTLVGVYPHIAGTTREEWQSYYRRGFSLSTVRGIRAV